MKRLTKKEKGFVKDFIITNNATEAAKRNYEIESPNIDNVAGSIGSENLTKPKILNAIADALPNELLAKRHLELLNKREVIKMFNGEGKIIDQPDTQAVAKGLDMAYKVKGVYVSEKPIGTLINIAVRIENKELESLREEYEKKLKAKLLK